MTLFELDPSELRKALERFARENVVTNVDRQCVTVSAKPVHLTSHEFGTRNIPRRTFLTRGPH